MDERLIRRTAGRSLRCERDRRKEEREGANVFRRKKRRKSDIQRYLQDFQGRCDTRNLVKLGERERESGGGIQGGGLPFSVKGKGTVGENPFNTKRRHTT